MKVSMCGFILHVSEGNSKLGKTMNWSLTPGQTCSKDACNTCYKNGCYARGIVSRRENVAKAWGDNTRAMMWCEKNDYWSSFICTMDDIINKRQPKSFRIHVGGDFFSRDYFVAWVKIAMLHPEVSFFAFTKQWDKVKGIALPKNFALIASSWTGLVIPKWAKGRLPVAWLVEKGCPVPVRRNRKTHVCQGDCTKCHWCDTLKKNDVAFMKHR